MRSLLRRIRSLFRGQDGCPPECDENWHQAATQVIATTSSVVVRIEGHRVFWLTPASARHLGSILCSAADAIDQANLPAERN